MYPLKSGNEHPRFTCDSSLNGLAVAEKRWRKEFAKAYTTGQLEEHTSVAAFCEEFGLRSLRDEPQAPILFVTMVGSITYLGP